MTDTFGTKGNDTLSATGPDGLLVGKSGNDQIRGGTGSDVIYGDNNSTSIPGAKLYGYEVIADRTATVTFQGESAGYRNTLGMYRVDKDGNILGVEVIFPNASEKGSGGELIAGRSSAAVELHAGEQVGFFVVPDGFSRTPDTLARKDGFFKFLDSTGADGRMRSGPDLSLWFFPSDGSAPQQAKSHYGTAIFFSRDALNSDNISHVRTAADEATGIVKIGFEDLLGGGDKDFDDAQFSIDVGVENVPSFPSTKVYSAVASDDMLWGGDGDDKMYGGSGLDQLWGETGNDALYGGSGDDQLWGGAGNDRLEGGVANDRMWGGEGDDYLLGGGGNDFLFGERADDQLLGGAGDDQMRDGEGADLVNGGSGLDTLFAGRGNDTYIGGEGFDTIDFGAAPSAVTVDLGKKVASGALGDDVIKTFERVLGSKFDDTISGNGAVNTLEGRDGADILRGAGGNDTLIGGKGADVFAWAARSDIINTKTGMKSVDVIKDFDASVDKLDFTTLMTKAKGDKAMLFHLDETDAGTMVQVNLGKYGWFDVAMLEGAKLGDADHVSADWLLF